MGGVQVGSPLFCFEMMRRETHLQRCQADTRSPPLPVPQPGGTVLAGRDQQWAGQRRVPHTRPMAHHSVRRRQHHRKVAGRRVRRAAACMHAWECRERMEMHGDVRVDGSYRQGGDRMCPPHSGGYYLQHYVVCVSSCGCRIIPDMVWQLPHPRGPVVRGRDKPSSALIPGDTEHGALVPYAAVCRAGLQDEAGWIPPCRSFRLRLTG